MTEIRPVLDQINLVVGDMETSAAFYERLGLTIPTTIPIWDRHHRSVSTPEGLDLDLDSTEFAAKWDEGWPGTRGRGGVVLGFKVASRADVDRLHADLTATGAPSRQAPYDAFWGARYAIVEDPDGNAVGIMSPIDPARKSAPPEM